MEASQQQSPRKSKRAKANGRRQAKKKKQAARPDPKSLANNAQADGQVRSILTEMDDLKAKRAKVNAELTKCRKTLYAMGHTRDAVGFMERYRNMDEDKREAADLSLLHLRRACGMYIQQDLLDATKSKTH